MKNKELSQKIYNVVDMYSQMDVYVERVDRMILDLVDEFFYTDEPTDREILQLSWGYNKARIHCDIAASFIHKADVLLQEMYKLLQEIYSEVSADPQEVEK